MSLSDLVGGEELRSVLDDLPGFRAMPTEVRSLVNDAFEPVSYDFGSVIVREGDDADAFYVLVSGTARVVKQAEQGTEVPLNLLRRGDSFGEMGLVGDSTRMATVRASAPVEALRLDKDVFQALTRRDPGVKESFERLARFRTVQNFLRLYSEFDSLPVDGLAQIATSLEPVKVDASEIVVREGDPPGPMYVVEEGRLRIYRERDGARDDLEYLRKGDFFAEFSVLHGEPRRASVEAVTPCLLLALPPELFEHLLTTYPEFRRRVEERAAQREYRRVARVPLDFAEEILPAEVEAVEKVGLDQIEDEARAATEPLDEVEARPTRQRRRRLPYVHQLDEMDCGAACLAMVTRYYGKTVPLPRIRELVHTSTDGTSLLGIARGAEELGLAARTVRASKSKPERLPLPAVVHWEGNHWVVLYEVGERKVRVGDPARSVRRLSRDEFDENWSGYTALFEPTPEFERLPEGKPSYAWLKPILYPYR